MLETIEGKSVTRHVSLASDEAEKEGSWEGPRQEEKMRREFTESGRF